MNLFNKQHSTALLLTILSASVFSLTGCGGSSSLSSAEDEAELSGESTHRNELYISPYTVVQGGDLNSKASPLLSLNPGGPGGSPNQSLRSGDVLYATDTDSVIIGGLGVDILFGNSGNDVLIGGTEDFNSSVDGDDRGADNRDRAFGKTGDDVFIWAPGDGSDFFDGGEGIDVLVFGVLGEERNSNGSIEGAPFFNVNPPNREGSQDFDGIFLDENNLPIVNVSTSPGFCSVLAEADFPEEFELLDLDHVVRFTLRGIANDFDTGLREDDDGLRVAVSAKSVEYLVCTNRDTGIEVLDLRSTPATPVDLSQLPNHIAAIIR